MENEFRFELERKKIEKSLINKNLVANLFYKLQQDFLFSHCQPTIKPQDVSHIKNMDIHNECKMFNLAWTFVFKNGKFKDAYFKDIKTNLKVDFDLQKLYKTKKPFSLLLIQISNEINNKVINHLNTLLFDNKLKIVEHFEPMGFDERMYNYLRKMYVYIKNKIPYKYVFVNEEPIQVENEHVCISLNILYINLRLFYKKDYKLTIHHIMNWILAFTKQGLYFYIDMGEDYLKIEDKMYYFYLLTYSCYISNPESYKIFE